MAAQPTPDWGAVRRDFPTTERFTYLDCANKAPLLRPVEMAIHEWTADIYERAGERAFSMEGIEATRQAVARLVGVPSGTVALIKNTSEGINILAQGMGLAPGDNVLVSDFEHENNTFPWRYLATKGVDIRRIQPTADGRVPPSAFAAQMDSRTRAIAAAWVVYGNGYRLDLPALAKLCRQRGARLIVDGVHGIGVLATPLAELGADAVVAGGHKSLYSLAGAGFMYVREDFIGAIQPPYAAKFSFTSLERWYQPLTLASDAHRFEYGNPNYLGTWAQRRAAEYLTALGPNHIEAHLRALTTHLIGRLDDRDLKVRTPKPWHERAAIVSLEVPGDPRAVVAALRTKHIIVSARDGCVRASVGIYNDLDDIDIFVDALPR